MTDITSILGGPWAPPPVKEKNTAPPETQLSDAMLSAGLTPPATIYLDGKIHRFRSGTKGRPGKSDKAGWYVAFGDGVPAGRFGCFRAGVEHVWRADVGRELSAEEMQQHARRQAEAQAIRDAAAEKRREAAANTVDKIWTSATPAHPEHPYLMRKKIGVHGARTTGDGRLIVPLYDATGMLSSLQYIDADGTKRYHPGGATTGRFWSVGPFDDPGILYIAEGFATAATIHEVTDRPVIVAYSASNLVPATGAIRDLYGASQDIVIVADNDASGIGLRYAEQAAAKYGARIVPIPIDGDANDYVSAGYDLSALLQPPQDRRYRSLREMQQDPPLRWIIKDILLERSIMLIYGQTMAGKSTVLCNMLWHLASGRDWQGHRVRRKARVMYVAGEDSYGIRMRFNALGGDVLDDVYVHDRLDLASKQSVAALVAHLRETRADILALDTIASLSPTVRENTDEQKIIFENLKSIIDAYPCAITAAGHAGKREENGPRGWSGAGQTVDTMIHARILDGANREIFLEKQKNGRDGYVIGQYQLAVRELGVDEDGDAITTVVCEFNTDTQKVEKRNAKTIGYIRTFENAWCAAAREIREGAPYLSRSAMLNYLTQNDGMSEATARQYVQPGKQGRLITELLGANVVQATENGWIVVDKALASAMLIS